MHRLKSATLFRSLARTHMQPRSALSCEVPIMMSTMVDINFSFYLCNGKLKNTSFGTLGLP